MPSTLACTVHKYIQTETRKSAKKQKTKKHGAVALYVQRAAREIPATTCHPQDGDQEQIMKAYSGVCFT